MCLGWTKDVEGRSPAIAHRETQREFVARGLLAREEAEQLVCMCMLTKCWPGWMRLWRKHGFRNARLSLALMLLMLFGPAICGGAVRMASAQAMDVVTLPQPLTESHYPVERALRQRRSLRDFAATALTLKEVSQLLWAAQGVTSPQGLRTTPSAGALYPLETYFVAGNVSGLAPGIYRYLPRAHRLVRVSQGDKRANLAAAALGQPSISKAPGVVVLTAVERRTTGKYGPRGIAYLEREAGHAAQNLLLQATALGLGGVPIGAFVDARVAAILGLPADARPLYLIPVGRPGPGDSASKPRSAR